MSFAETWRSWRIKVHDILEVGGEAHPMGRVVNVFSSSSSSPTASPSPPRR
jgi:hypothetical protein